MDYFVFDLFFEKTFHCNVVIRFIIIFKMTCITKTHLFLLMFPFLLVSSRKKESQLEAMFQKEIQELQIKMCGKMMFKLLEKYTLF